jgi:hypothetical protein
MTTASPRVAPPEWPGSLPEFLVFEELERRNLRNGIDFIYQSRQFGGRLAKGGAVVDFLFFNPPNLAINVQGEFFHYRTSLLRANDQLQRVALEGSGIHIIYIDESDILANVSFYVGEALKGNDLSRMTRGR